MLFQPLKSSHPVPVALLNSSQVLGVLPLAYARQLPRVRNKFAAVVIRNNYENKQTESTYCLYNIVFQAWIQKICFWITPVTPAILLSLFHPLPYPVLCRACSEVKYSSASSWKKLFCLWCWRSAICWVVFCTE